MYFSFKLLYRHRFSTILILIIICLFFVHDRSTDLKYPKSNRRNSKEVYVTLLCPPNRSSTSNDGGNDYYFEGTRVLTYRLLHKSSTKDIDNRQLIVLATESVLPKQIDQLRQDGAIVKVVSAIPVPKAAKRYKTNSRWKDQYTKLLLWNMTEYSKILYIDSDILPIRPLSPVFNTPFSIDKDGDRYLFAATYESMITRTFGKYTRPVPVLGPNDTHGSQTPHAGLFLIHPCEKQAKYLQSLYDNPPPNQDFTSFMEQSMLKYAYRDKGDYHWTRLSQMYNTQWPRLQDMKASHALHDKFWREDSPVAWNLRRYWYVAWGEMQGWSEERQRKSNK